MRPYNAFFFIPAQARKKAKKSTVTAVTSNVKDGLFTVEKNGNDWFFIIRIHFWNVAS